MDAVILYVDGSDPQWQKDYYRGTATPISPERFRDWGTLKYLFRGIAKNFPWLDKIFLVVSRESQVPGWIDREKVRVVLHKEIIPAEYLPTFNSCVIETHIPYIKDLSEEFLYFNDDMFPLNPADPELFYKEGRPQLWLIEHDISGTNNMYRKQCLNSLNYAKTALGQREGSVYYNPPHWPHPMLKSQCLEVLEKMQERYRNQVSVLRTERNINQYLFLDYVYLKGLADNVRLPYKYLAPTGRNIQDTVNAIKESREVILCLNDSDCGINDYPLCKRSVCDAFEEKYPEKCKYEYGYEFKTDIIVSMTSYPARIIGVEQVWQTILSQETDVPFRCVLTLAEEEFPDRRLPKFLQRIIDEGKVELIWYPRNIRSHKKIIPVLQKYPDATVITTDDDIERPQGWLGNLLEDHRKYPNDIITNSLSFFLDGNLELQRLRGLEQAKAKGKNHIPGLVGNFIRFGSGSGTLFPAHTFTDERFFNESLFMGLSPTSDESWVFLFAILADKTIRQTSRIYDESATYIPGSQAPEISLWKKNRKIYPEIFRKFFTIFPEFREKILERQHRAVVSLTSYPARFAVLPKVLNSLLSQTIRPSRIVLTLAKEDVAMLPDEVKRYIDSGAVRLLVADEDLKPHNKYFWTMKEYQNYAVITVDDDIIYQPTMVETLLRGYWSHPDCVIARRVHKIERFDCAILPYDQWTQRCKTVLEPSSELLATGVGGVLYPPNILGLSENNLSEIKDVLFADDIYLKALEQRRGIKVLFVPDAKDKPLNGEQEQESALYKINVLGGKNNDYIRRLLR